MKAQPRTRRKVAARRRCQHWTAAEEAVLRKAYRRPGRGTAARVAKLLGRSLVAVQHHADVMTGVARAVRWTSTDEQRLREAWNGACGARKILGLFPHRTWDAILTRVGRLGLDRVPQGYIRVRAAAARLGVTQKLLGTILDWASVARLKLRSRTANKRPRPYTLMVEWDAARDALVAWDARESLKGAARRLRISRVTLRRLVDEAGIRTALRVGRHARLLPEALDRLVAEHRARRAA